METNEFEKLMSEAPERADETKINLEPETTTANDPPAEKTAEGEEAAPEPIKMNVAQFGATMTGIYCAVSDFVYKKIKKTDTAPAWTNSDREALNAALVPVMEQYNVTVTPTTNLIITIAVVEAMRYSRPAAAIELGGDNE